MRVFCLCVYSFLICWFPLGVFGSHFALLGPWASFWTPLGRLWLPRGCPWRHFGLLLAPLGLRGAIWGTLGSQAQLGVTLGHKWTSFPSLFGAFAMPAHKKRPCGNQRWQRRQRRIHAKWYKSRSSQPHFTRAGG